MKDTGHVYVITIRIKYRESLLVLTLTDIFIFTAKTKSLAASNIITWDFIAKTSDDNKAD